MTAKQQRVFSVELDSWGWTSTGSVRGENQDSFLNWNARLLWAVMDGVGGGSGGREAGQLVTRSLLSTSQANSLEQHVAQTRQALCKANAQLLQNALPGTVSASTAVVLLMHAGEAACLWAGDSHCYLLRDGILYQCTREHTLRQDKIRSGALTAPEARRMIRANIITNAVGVHAELKLEEVRFSLRDGDRFLLCSDGLSSLLGPEALAARLGAPTARAAAASLAQSLQRLAQPDNITFVLVFVSPLR